MNLLVEYQYFPSVILFKISYNYSNIAFEQYEYYQKMGFRNRCRIAGAGGTIDLSVPLEKGRDQKALIKDVKIAGRRNWQAEHWKTILSCYNRSPWFEFYRDGLRELYDRPFVFLIEWDLACFEWALAALKMKTPVSFTAEYTGEPDPASWSDWRGRIRPANLGDFPPLKYRQVFEDRIGFLPNLSILDLLFCEGPGAPRILSSGD